VGNTPLRPGNKEGKGMADVNWVRPRKGRKTRGTEKVSVIASREERLSQAVGYHVRGKKWGGRKTQKPHQERREGRQYQENQGTVGA